VTEGTIKLSFSLSAFLWDKLREVFAAVCWKQSIIPPFSISPPLPVPHFNVPYLLFFYFWHFSASGNAFRLSASLKQSWQVIKISLNTGLQPLQHSFIHPLYFFLLPCCDSPHQATQLLSSCSLVFIRNYTLF
jgi:hypothetical protein